MTPSPTILIVLLILGLSILILGLVSMVANFRVYEKAHQAGWKIFVPFYSNWTLAKIGSKPAWYGLVGFVTLLTLLPVHNTNKIVLTAVVYIVSYIFSILVGIGIAHNFGRSSLFGIFFIGLIPFIGFMILGFGKSAYILPKTDSLTPIPDL